MHHIKELFQKLVDSELLKEDTKAELEKEFDSVLAEAVENAKKETEEKVRTELTEQFVADKEELVEALDTKAQVYLEENLAEFKDDIERFRDLEAEYAAKIVETRNEMAETVQKDMKKLVERLDQFLEQRLQVEFTELKESIDEVKQLEFGRRIFEAVQEEFKGKYLKEDDTVKNLKEAQEELKNVKSVLETKERTLNTIKREQKLNEVLEPLHGRPREVMAAILNTVPVEKLDEQYSKFIGRVLHESVTETSTVEESTKSEKENANASVLAEGKDTSETEGNSTTRVVTGDTPVLENDNNSNKTELSQLNESDRERLKKLAGIN